VRTTLEALCRSLTRGRQLAVAVVSGGAYAAAVIAMPHWELIHGLPGMRPALALLVVLAVLGGAPAAVGGLLGGIAIGLAGAGAVGGGALPALAEGLAGLLIGIIGWKAGWLLRVRTDPDAEVRPRVGEVIWDLLLISLMSGTAYTSFLAWMGEALDAHPFPYVAVVEGVNSLLALVVLTVPLFLILHPIARGAKVVWVDPRGDAAKAGSARVGRALVWTAVILLAVSGFVLYSGAPTQLTLLADPRYRLYTLWVIQAPFTLMLWLGALMG
jgi:hypothetical protein